MGGRRPMPPFIMSWKLVTILLAFVAISLVYETSAATPPELPEPETILFESAHLPAHGVKKSTKASLQESGGQGVTDSQKLWKKSMEAALKAPEINLEAAIGPVEDAVRGFDRWLGSHIHASAREQLLNTRSSIQSKGKQKRKRTRQSRRRTRKRKSRLQKEELAREKSMRKSDRIQTHSSREKKRNRRGKRKRKTKSSRRKSRHKSSRRRKKTSKRRTRKRKSRLQKEELAREKSMR